jgi:AAHS family 4-hydroxybenzoate transporter-like MFS transporter
MLLAMKWSAGSVFMMAAVAALCAALAAFFLSRLAGTAGSEDASAPIDGGRSAG